uniref:Uncharacterized protein n=1 Tax=Candidatus Kentrum sp. LPFa TaxID=2126335 RepID=A0A450X3V8_9GAMM|nr:MAG: hypothetical protein BECKLPF1236A_GA0070988_1000813 [Candidatus Kentron sp. LPFa]VFK23967.1 MAG: hypothetical protein BECKLPF1236C_GA0070990_1000913 [Candidatus Kentron sp. LPFa]
MASVIDPLNLISALAAVLAVGLTLITVIAHRNVDQARNAAEKAKTEAEEARKEVRIVSETVIARAEALALTSHLLERMQVAARKSSDLSKEADAIVDQDQSASYALNLNASGLGILAGFFSSLHRWMLEPHLISTDDLNAQAVALGPFLQKLHQPDTIGSDIRSTQQRLRADHWQPAARLLENLLKSIRTPSFSINVPASELDKVSKVLRNVREELNRL